MATLVETTDSGNNPLMNTQQAPFPDELQELVKQAAANPPQGVHRVTLGTVDRGQGCSGLTLSIYTATPDVHSPGKTRYVVHYMIVPAAAYDRRSWRRWLFEQFHLVDLHELMENFEVDGKQPYHPSHGPGNDPYMVREPDGTDLDRRTQYTGEVKP